MSGRYHFPHVRPILLLIFSCLAGALSSVNLLKNDIDIGQASALVSILKEHPTLKSLCGNTGDETELDMRGKEMSVDGAMSMLALEIINNGALQCIDGTPYRLKAPFMFMVSTQSVGGSLVLFFVT
jgi:hypothetical protein